MNISHFLVDLSQSKRTQIGKVDFELQSFAQQVFSSIWNLESEVNNGGFEQYFANYSAESAHKVVTALSTIGAMKMSDICKRSIDVAFPSGLPKDPDEIVAIARSGFDSKTQTCLNELTEEYFLYPDNITELLFEFVKSHPEEFGPVP